MLEATKSFPLHIYLIKYKSKHTQVFHDIILLLLTIFIIKLLFYY